MAKMRYQESYLKEDEKENLSIINWRFKRSEIGRNFLTIQFNQNTKIRW